MDYLVTHFQQNWLFGIGFCEIRTHGLYPLMTEEREVKLL
jgi:hypothetical protein